MAVGLKLFLDCIPGIIGQVICFSGLLFGLGFSPIKWFLPPTTCLKAGEIILKF